jgi:hypothetical protein
MHPATPEVTQSVLALRLPGITLSLIDSTPQVRSRVRACACRVVSPSTLYRRVQEVIFLTINQIRLKRKTTNLREVCCGV